MYNYLNRFLDWYIIHLSRNNNNNEWLHYYWKLSIYFIVQYELFFASFSLCVFLMILFFLFVFVSHLLVTPVVWYRLYISAMLLNSNREEIFEFSLLINVYFFCNEVKDCPKKKLHICNRLLYNWVCVYKKFTKFSGLFEMI